MEAFVHAGINTNWLLTGEGAMLLSSEKVQQQPGHYHARRLDLDMFDGERPPAPLGHSDQSYNDRMGTTLPVASALDVETLTYVIEVVEDALIKRKLVLDSGRKAVLMQLLYEYCIDTGSRKPDMVEKFLKLVG